MYVLCSTLCYVAVCMFCAVRCLNIICFSLLFSNYWTYVFDILFVCIFVFYIVYSVFLYCLVHRFSFCVVPFLFLYKSTDRCHKVETQLQ
jgi:hypothetical protein